MPSKQKGSVRVRIAPSPTGSLHLGTARTALFNWLFAKQHDGKFILRIEDTDKERSTRKSEAEIIEGLSWLGIDWDEGINAQDPEKDLGALGPYRQSERSEKYKTYLEKLIAEKKAYWCYCSKEELEAQREAMLTAGLPPKYNNHCRNLKEPPPGKKPRVIRFVTPEKIVEFHDLIRGKVSFDSSLFGDIVIAKSLDEPLYNFAVVIDDAEMAISHVIRGEDHLSNTPKQILFQESLAFSTPVYAHLPLILAADRSKLSKRYADTSLLDYRSKGYLPEAIVNFLVLMGWHPEGPEEVFTPEELIKKFSLSRVQKSGAIFDVEKLSWLNAQHIRRTEPLKLLEMIRPQLEKEKISAPEKFVIKIITAEKERLKTINDFLEIAGFFFRLPDYETKMLKWKDETLPEVKISLQKSLEKLSAIGENEFKVNLIRQELDAISDKTNRGKIFWPIRIALSGKKVSPDPTEIAYILGKKETLRRIEQAIAKTESIRENHYENTS